MIRPRLSGTRVSGSSVAAASCTRAGARRSHESHPRKCRRDRRPRVGRYSWARYYHPQLQRFVSEDPIAFTASDPNLYVYVRNNPMFWLDPDGLRVLNPRNYPISPDVRRALEHFNTYIGADKDVLITGGDRPVSSRLGARGRSTHVQGIAADVVVPGQAHSVTTYQAIESGLFGGVGWYEEGYRGPEGEGPHVHVDLRRVPATWGYDREGNYYQPLPPLLPNPMAGRKP